VILDDGTILPDSDAFSPPPKGSRRVDYHDGVAHITSSAEKHTDPEIGTNLTIQIPEKLSIDCFLPLGGSITVDGKVEGDVHFCTADGDIRVKKLRGQTLHLQAENKKNTIVASDLLEAVQLIVKTSGRVRAKQVHGSSIHISVENSSDRNSPIANEEEVDDEGSLVDISALFVSGQGGASIEVKERDLSRRAVRVKSNHGPLRVETEGVSTPTETNAFTGEHYPIVELGGVNGQCEVSISNTRSSYHADYASCLLHLDSLSPDSVSLVTVDSGDVAVTVDRKVEADLRLLSMMSGESLEETGALLADEEDEEMIVNVLRHLETGDGSPEAEGSRISTKTKAFTAKSTSFRSRGVDYVEGFVENRSAEPDSRFERKVQGDSGGSIGKIRLEGAADQALRGFSGGSETNNEEASSDRPLVAVVGTGRISMESVSWLGAIARRYGLEESGREPGRTASRKGRSLAPTHADE
jgi:hypothetical protein